MTTPCAACGALVATRHCTACGTRRTETAIAVDEQTAAGRRATLIGLAMMVGGMIVTFATFMNAERGSTFLALTGLVLFGMFRTGAGLKTMWDASRLPRV